jgi:hypothetical protein
MLIHGIFSFLMIDEVTIILVMKLFYCKHAETHHAVTVELFLPMFTYIFLSSSILSSITDF